MEEGGSIPRESGKNARIAGLFLAPPPGMSCVVPADPLLPILRDRFGHGEFRGGQKEVVEGLLAGRSMLAVFPTGGGKSLCYQLPALLLEGVTLVVSPLIALMKDQVDALRGRGIAAARLDSTLGREEYEEVIRSLGDGSLKILYVAPERLSNEGFRAPSTRPTAFPNGGTISDPIT